MYKSENEDDSFLLICGDVEKFVQGFTQEDYNHWHPIYKAEAKNQMLRLRNLMQLYVPEEARNWFATSIEGALRVQTRLAITEALKAKNVALPRKAHRAASSKREAVQELVRRIAREHRNIDGSSKTASQLVKPVQDELEKQGRPLLGKKRNLKGVDENSAARAVRRHLNGFMY